MSFGPLVTRDQVAAAVIRTLREWTPTHLSALCLARGPASLSDNRRRRIVKPPAPGHIRTMPPGGEVDRPEDGIPRMYVAVGPAENPERDGEGRYSASFPVTVMVLHGTATEEAVETQIGWLQAVVCQVLLQHQSLGGLADRVRWDRAPEPEGVGPQAGRVFRQAQCDFTVHVDGIVDESTGPNVPDPPDDPHTPDPGAPIVETVHVTVTGEDPIPQ